MSNYVELCQCSKQRIQIDGSLQLQCTTSRNLAVLTCRENVAILGKDDKALIPLGIPATNSQSRILMNMGYLVTLPDHEFVVTSKHKLIPPIYASKGISDERLGLDSFKSFSKQSNVDLNPMWVFTKDEHDGFRFPTTQRALIGFFKENNIDYIVAVCKAAGLCAYRFIKRRIAQLSTQLAGIVLPHVTYGIHLNGNDKTIDPN